MSLTNAAPAKTAAQPSVVHDSFTIERNYNSPPERVFHAFSDPATKRRWSALGDHHDLLSYELDFRPGGSERTTFHFKPGVPIAGQSGSNQTTFLDIVPNRRLVSSSLMSIAGHPISADLVTFEFLASGTGTALLFTCHIAFFENADGPDMRRGGWRVLLDRLGAELAR